MRALPWLLLLGVLAAGCGGAATAADSAAEYETAVTAALDGVAEPLAALEGAEGYVDLVSRLEESEARAREAAGRLRAIAPPPGVETANQALVAALAVLAEDLHRVAETLASLREEGMPPAYPALIETLGALSFEDELLRDALLQLRNEGIEPGSAR